MIKKAIEDQLYKLQRSGTGELVNVVDKYVRPYIVGRYDLIGLEWDAATEDIIVVYVGKQKPRPDHVVVHGHDVPIDVLTGNLTTDGDSQPRPDHVVVHGHDVPIDVLTGNLTSDGDSPAEIPRLFETPEEMPLKPVPVRTVDVTPGNLSKIEHIVVLMQENRSFDHVLGYLSRDGMLPRRNLTRGDESEGRQPPQTDVEGLLPGDNQRDMNVFQNHEYRSTRSHATAWPSYSLPGPYHGADAVTRQVSDRMKDFVMEWARHIPGGTFEEHQLVMNYMTDAELPTYGALTREFAICDCWHCSHLGGTLPNRFISLTGDFSRDSFGSPEVQNPDLLEFAPLEAPTFFDHLTAHGVKWKLFEHGYSMLRLVRNFTFDETNIAGFDDEFEAVVAAGLPPVTFIEPDYIETPTGISNDDHAPADMINGQRLIARIMKALLANKEQWAKTLFIITYDEHGGFYDHVEPPTHVETKNPDGSVTQTPIPPLSVGEPRLGVRVPGFVISPWHPGRERGRQGQRLARAVRSHVDPGDDPAPVLRSQGAVHGRAVGRGQ